jgi:predicted DNA-binding protein
MSTPPSKPSDHNLTVRLPSEMHEFVEKLAKQMCNTNAGIVRLALTKFREGMQAGRDAANQQQEAASC